MIDAPVSESITMRPVWHRRQVREYLQKIPLAPTDAEMHDAVLVLADPENQILAPALHLEAFRILDEAGQ